MKYLIFDFDGTLVDNLPLVFKLLQEDLLTKNIDLRKYPLDELRQIGVKNFVKQIKISKLSLLLTYRYIKKNIHKQIQDCLPVKNVETILSQLAKNHKLVIYSSNKPENISLYLNKYHLSQYFSGIYEDDSYFGKEVGLKKIIKKLKIEAAECTYIGDESRDIIAAKKACMISVGVTWGFEGDKPLSEAKPDYLFTKPEELLKL